MLTVLKIGKGKSKLSTRNLPPGPFKLPIIGNIHLLISSTLPHRKLKILAQKYGPLMRLKLGEVSYVVVSSPEVAKEMMKTHDVNFSQRPPIPTSSRMQGRDIIFSPYGDYWKHVRRICTQELLTAKRAKSFHSIREEEVSNLLGFLRSNRGHVVNLSQKIFSTTYSITARSAFGVKCKEIEEFIAAAQELMEFGLGFSICDLFPSQRWLHWVSGRKRKMDRIFHKVYQILQRIIDECKANKERSDQKDANVAECLLEVLLNLQGSHDLGFVLETSDIKAVIQDMFVAGSDTSSVVLEWAMLELIKNPKVLEKVQAEVREVFGREGNVEELEFLHLVIKETLRLYPSGPLTLRESIQECVIFGYDIPAKTKCLINLWALGRDPRYWIDPERFYPERFHEKAVDYKGTDFEFIPFGAGRRICPGIPFGIENIKFTLAQLLFHFDWKFPDGMDHKNLDMSERFGTALRRKEDLYLVPIPYNTYY